MTTSKRDAMAEEYKEKCLREAMTAVPQFISIDEAYKSVANSVIDYKAGWDARDEEISELKEERLVSDIVVGMKFEIDDLKNQLTTAREEARALREALRKAHAEILDRTKAHFANMGKGYLAEGHIKTFKVASYIDEALAAHAEREEQK